MWTVDRAVSCAETGVVTTAAAVLVARVAADRKDVQRGECLLQNPAITRRSTNIAEAEICGGARGSNGEYEVLRGRWHIDRRCPEREVRRRWQSALAATRARAAVSMIPISRICRQTLWHEHLPRGFVPGKVAKMIVDS